MVPISGSKFGQRLQPMEYGGMYCRGNEASILHCEVNTGFVETWSKLFFSNQGDYAGVRCIPRTASKNKQVLIIANYYASLVNILLSGNRFQLAILQLHSYLLD